MQLKHQVILLKKDTLKKLENRKTHITVMLAVSTDCIELPPYVFLIHKAMPKEQLPTGIVVKCQNHDEHLQI